MYEVISDDLFQTALAAHWLAGWLLSGLLTEGQPKQECFPANICATMHRAYTILSMLRCARAPWPIYCVRTGLMGALIKCRRKYRASINV